MPTACLVVPCYNEEHRLDPGAFTAFLRAWPEVSCYFVDDGSQDGTLARLNALRRDQENQVRVLALEANSGKAEAVRLGMLAAHAWRIFDYIGYWDADLATPLDEFPAMLRLAEGRSGCVIVLGSRNRQLSASIKRTPARYYPGRAFAALANLVLRMQVYDTQCGAKLLKADVVPEVCRHPFASRWFFDVELLARLRNLIGREAMTERAIEAPLERWSEKGGSRLTISEMLRAPFELWAIARKYNQER